VCHSDHATGRQRTKALASSRAYLFSIPGSDFAHLKTLFRAYRRQLFPNPVTSGWPVIREQAPRSRGRADLWPSVSVGASKP
jgi:hypothetical protein